MADTPLRVLIADDHPMFLATLERVVNMHPQLSLVAAVADGRTALGELRSSTPDVAVVDLRMPELDGTQLLDAVQQEGLATRIVLLTGHLDPPAVYRAVELGAAAVLSKLVEPAELTDAILAVARGTVILSAEVQAIVAGEVRARHHDDRPLLSSREREILQRIADGETVAIMAASMHLSASTVKSHVESLYRKLSVSDRGAVVAVAMRRGLLH